MKLLKGSFFTLLLVCFVAGTANGEGFVNGSFEDRVNPATGAVEPGMGGYHGWKLTKANNMCTFTSVTNDEFVLYKGKKLDHKDSLDNKSETYITQTNRILLTEQLPDGAQGKSFYATDGMHAAAQLNNNVDYLRMEQDVILPANATAITWDVSFENMSTSGYSLQQYLSVSLRDTNDTILVDANGLQVQWITDDTSPMDQPDMMTVSLTLPPNCPSTVRVVVELNLQTGYFTANIDNFRIEIIEEVVTEAPLKKMPPSWLLNPKKGWTGDDGGALTMPPGLDKNGKLPAGLMKDKAAAKAERQARKEARKAERLAKKEAKKAEKQAKKEAKKESKLAGLLARLQDRIKKLFNK